MRVDQIITLVWVGNVALLGGTGFVGFKFYEQRKGGNKAPVVAWPETEAKGVDLQRWPGPVTGFKTIWETQINGLVPPPPPPPDTTPTKPVNLADAFRARITIISGMESGDPASLAAKISDNGTEKLIWLGYIIDGWKLVQFTIDRAESKARAVFQNPRYEKDDGRLTIEQVVPQWKDPVKDGGFVTPTGEPPFTAERVRRDFVETQAYIEPATGEWVIPAEELYWWSEYGTEEVLAKTTFAERPEGVELASQPPRAALDGPRGIVQGDVIVSINGVLVKTLNDIVGYLQGPGRDEKQYSVVIERDGARRTTVYRAARNRAR